MKKFLYIFIFILISSINIFSQSMHFCEQFKDGKELGLGSRFTLGTFCIVVQDDNPIGISDGYIQFDKQTNKGFVFYKKFEFIMNPKANYIYFQRKDLSIDEPGFYRIFLLDKNNKTISSALIEFIK